MPYVELYLYVKPINLIPLDLVIVKCLVLTVKSDMSLFIDVRVTLILQADFVRVK